MAETYYQITSTPSPVIGGFQNCEINSEELTDELWKKAKHHEVWLSIRAHKSSRILCRLCESRVEDAADLIRSDMRVWQINSDAESSSSLHLSSSLDKEEIDLAWNIMRLEGREVVVVSAEEKLATGRRPSMKFNDTLCCTSNDIQMLMPTTIKRMTATVVFASDKNDKEPPSGVDSKSEQITTLIAEKIRDVLDANHILVMTRTLVDLRQCPLAQSTLLGPAISYVYIDHCDMDAPTKNGIGKVSPKTEILVERSHSLDYYRRIYESIQPCAISLAGLELPMKLLEETIRMQEERRRTKSKRVDGGHFSGGLLIAGSPGCGKTLVVRETAKKLRANLLMFTGTSVPVHSTTLFSDKITKVFASAVKSARLYPTVLLLEDLEVLSPAAGKALDSSSSVAKAKLVYHLCDLFDGIPHEVSLTIVVTSNQPHLVPLELRRAGRLQQEVYIRLPDEKERLQILESLTAGSSLYQEYDLSLLAALTPGYAGADLERLVHTGAIKCLEENGRAITEAHIKYALSRVPPASLQGSVGLIDIQRAISLDDIAGLHSVKLDLIKAIVWPLKYPDAFLTMGIQPPKGILLYGPPGCAKTSLVRAMAASHQTNFLSVSAAELFSSAVGDSEKIIVNLFHRARLASPCILFIDELEAVVGSRQSKSKGVNEGVLSTFLTEMDGVGTRTSIISGTGLNKGNALAGPRVVVVAATNRPDLIDSALLRPGRLDRIIPVPPPNESERLELLRKSTSRMPLAQDVDLAEIARETERYSGADLVNLCKEAALFALTEDMDIQSVAMKHFRKAKAESSPSLSVDLLKRFQEYSHPQQRE